MVAEEGGLVAEPGARRQAFSLRITCYLGTKLRQTIAVVPFSGLRDAVVLPFLLEVWTPNVLLKGALDEPKFISYHTPQLSQIIPVVSLQLLSSCRKFSSIVV